MPGPLRESQLLNPDFRDILSAFCDENVEFMLVGAYALAAHGLPRATGDLDLWVARSKDNARRVRGALARFGAPVSSLTEDELVAPALIFQIDVEPRRVDIMTSIDGVEFYQAWKHRLEVEIEGLSIPVIGREELLANKRAAGQPQDLADVSRLEAQGAR